MQGSKTALIKHWYTVMPRLQISVLNHQVPVSLQLISSTSAPVSAFAMSCIFWAVALMRMSWTRKITNISTSISVNSTKRFNIINPRYRLAVCAIAGETCMLLPGQIFTAFLLAGCRTTPKRMLIPDNWLVRR